MVQLIIGGIDLTDYLSAYQEGVEENVQVTTSPTGVVFSDLAYRRHAIDATVEDVPCTSGGSIGASLMAALRTRPCAVTYYDTDAGESATGNFYCEAVPRPKVLYLDDGDPVYEAFSIRLIASEGVAT